MIISTVIYVVNVGKATINVDKDAHVFHFNSDRFLSLFCTFKNGQFNIYKIIIS